MSDWWDTVDESNPGGANPDDAYAGENKAYGVPGATMYDDPAGGASAHFDNWGDWLGNMKDLGKGAMTIAGDLSAYNLGRQALSDATGSKVNIPGFFGPTDFPVDKGNPTLLAHALDAFQPAPASPAIDYQANFGGVGQGYGPGEDIFGGATAPVGGTPTPVVGSPSSGYTYRKGEIPDYTGGYGVHG